jgi:hypothetical protein
MLRRFLGRDNTFEYYESVIGHDTNRKMTSMSAADGYDLMKRMYTSDSENFEHMLEVLKDTVFASMLPKYLPKEVEVAHKIGFYSGFYHDVGIVYDDDQPYIIAVYPVDFPHRGDHRPSVAPDLRESLNDRSHSNGRVEHDAMTPDKHEKRKLIMKNYAAVAANKGSTDAVAGCSCSGTPMDAQDAARALGYSEDDLNAVPDAANMGLGCGNPRRSPRSSQARRCWIWAAAAVLIAFCEAAGWSGGTGDRRGHDADMVMLARQNAQKAGYANVSFRLGEIEHLPVADNSVDVIISNCVINLALKKSRYSATLSGYSSRWSVSISDIVATADLPDRIKNTWPCYPDVLPERSMSKTCVP